MSSCDSPGLSYPGAVFLRLQLLSPFAFPPQEGSGWRELLGSSIPSASLAAFSPSLPLQVCVQRCYTLRVLLGGTPI